MAIKYWDSMRPSPPSQEITRSMSIDLVSFGPLSCERRAPHDGFEKVLYIFHNAQERNAAKGLVELTYREIMELVIIPCLEEKLTVEQKEVAEDMFKSFGEWTRNALNIVNETAYLSIVEKGLFWNGEEYDSTRMAITEKEKAYSANGLLPGCWNPWRNIAKTTPRLIVDLHGRSYDQLPTVIKDSGIYLAPKGVAQPVGRGDGMGYGHSCGANGKYVVAAVRGAQRNTI